MVEVEPEPEVAAAVEAVARQRERRVKGVPEVVEQRKERGTKKTSSASVVGDRTCSVGGPETRNPPAMQSG